MHEKLLTNLVQCKFNLFTSSEIIYDDLYDIYWVSLLDEFRNAIYSFRYSNQVSIGDEVLVQENDELIPSKVITVSTLPLQGNNYYDD